MFVWGGMVTKPRRIFTSYCHRDEDFKTELDKHLTPLLLQGRVEAWSDRHIRAGAPLYEAIRDNIRAADIVLMLISADYVSSRSCQEEMSIALERSASKQTLSIPIVIRACDWTGLPIGQLLSANRDGSPINSAPDKDIAWYAVVVAIKQILNDWDLENPQELESNSDQADGISDAVTDEDAIRPADNGRSAGQWVYRKEANEADWDSVKSSIEEAFGSLAERDEDSGITIQTKRWGDKIIVDFRLSRHRNPRRLLIADIGGYVGYPGYQLEVYPRDENLRLPSERVRWMVNASGEYVLKQLEPRVGEEFTATGYAEHLWGAIRAMA